jgi:hypothetical protein
MPTLSQTIRLFLQPFSVYYKNLKHISYDIQFYKILY